MRENLTGHDPREGVEGSRAVRVEKHREDNVAREGAHPAEHVGQADRR